MVPFSKHFVATVASNQVKGKQFRMPLYGVTLEVSITILAMAKVVYTLLKKKHLKLAQAGLS